MGREPTRRLFFALWPNETERTALMHAVRRTVRGCGGRPVPGANLHLTLAFLGAVPAGRVPDLCVIARRAAEAFPAEALPLALSLQSLTHWPQPQVLAVLASEARSDAADGVRALAGMLASETAAAGFDPDLKPFRPHVTVARKVVRAPRVGAMSPVAWGFLAFALIESRTLESGPLYSVLESFVLGGAEKVRT